MVEMFFPGLWWLKYAVGALAGAIVAALVFTSLNAVLWRPAAVDEGRDIERADALKKSIELIQKRSQTNDEMRVLDSGALCRELDGRWVPEQNRCE